MKFGSAIFVFICLISCTSNKKSIQKEDFEKYELAYNTIAGEKNKAKPFFKEYNSDASGVKIVPKIFKLSKFNVYGIEYFRNEKSYQNKNIENLSKKYTNKNWRKDDDYKVLMPEEVKDFHGPLEYIYFSEIRNDSLRIEVLGNPFTKYSMTTGGHYLVVFERNLIKSIDKNIGHYD